jgi:hypothetical protein
VSVARRELWVLQYQGRVWSMGQISATVKWWIGTTGQAVQVLREQGNDWSG